MIIGLTGGIACGKSTVASIFKRKGFPVFESDIYCAELYNSGNKYLLRSIRERWGESFVTGNVPDKTKISKLVFNNNQEREWLNSIVHPMVLAGMRKFINKTSSTSICDVPLLFEARWENEFEKIITVWAPEKNVLERLMLRGYNKDESILRIKSQISNEKKLEMADYGIINSGSLSDLEFQCEKIIQKINNQTRGK